MAELFIAADDFTGALDTGVKLAQQGIGVRVVNDARMICACAETVMVANLDTRHLNRDEAYRRTLLECQKALKAGARTIYIKTDSGLRGNIGAALEAAARAVKGKVVFVPAYPALNRRTVNGVHLIGDVPVTQSVFGKDPLNPVKHDSVFDIISEQTCLPVYLRDSTQFGQEQCIELLELNTENEMLAYARNVWENCESKRRKAAKRKLRGRLMLRAAEKGRVKAYAGCAGFADVLGILLGLKPSARRKADIKLPVAVLSASLSEINFEQMRRGEEIGLESHLIPDILSREPCFKKPVADAVNCERGVLIESAKTKAEADELSDKGEKLGLDAAARAKRIALNMGRMTKALTSSDFRGTLCLFGGDVLSSALKELRCKALLPICELEPGVVISHALLPNGELNIVSKSGSFGSPDIIQKLINYAEENQ